MPSPFPGMNPYLESGYMWPDFHEAFVTAIRDAVAPQVSPNFYAKIEEQLYLHEMPEARMRFFGQADIGVRDTDREPAGGTALASRIAAPRQVTVPAHVVKLKLSYLVIYQRQSRQVVTVVELLSPSNKYAGPDRDAYLLKRARYVHSRSIWSRSTCCGAGRGCRGTVRCRATTASRCPGRANGRTWGIGRSG